MHHLLIDLYQFGVAARHISRRNHTCRKWCWKLICFSRMAHGKTHVSSKKANGRIGRISDTLYMQRLIVIANYKHDQHIHFTLAVLIHSHMPHKGWGSYTAIVYNLNVFSHVSLHTSHAGLIHWGGFGRSHPPLVEDVMGNLCALF